MPDPVLTPFEEEVMVAIHLITMACGPPVSASQVATALDADQLEVEKAMAVLENEGLIVIPTGSMN